MPTDRNHRHRARRAALALAAAALVATGLGTTGAGASAPAGASDQVLPERMRGEAAIRALGSRLPEVAAQNRMTADELRRSLRADDTLWVDPTGVLLFVDDDVWHDHAEVAPTGEPALATHDPSQAFLLHSRPASNRVIYLDFDGHDPATSVWKDKTVAQPYDADGNPSTFSDREREVIIQVWQHVAEDFAPFDVDVTTQDPGIDAIRRSTSSDGRFGTRVVITPTMSNCDGCGGVAYVGVFDRYGGSDSTGWEHDKYQPAWVYNGGYAPKAIAEAASHEAGHNLNLSHDGTATLGYYSGHNGWAPIMGVGYYQALSQWSKGEYAGANQTQDDLAVMASRGIPLAADDHVVTDLTGTAVEVEGLISTRTDVDAFRFTTDGGLLSLQVAPAPVSPNLDVELRLRDAAGGLLAAANPTTLGAALEQTLAAGTYTVEIDGVGTGDPTTGYSDYASLGRYRLTGVVPGSTGGSTGDDGGTGGGADEPTAAPGAFTFDTASAADGVVTLDWTDSSGAASYSILREQKHPKTGKWVSPTSLGTVTVSSFSETLAAGTYRYTVTAQNAVGSRSVTTGDVVVSTTSSGGGGTKGGGKGSAKTR